MLSTGNSAPQVCALNLLRTFRGEVPYARTKGIDRSLIDIPATKSWRVDADAEWVIDSYEPRVTLDEVRMAASADAGAAGDLSAVAMLTDRQGVASG
ncbi:early E1A protein [Olsenella sp. An293]|uniref:early E1A protein n=1 Tax=Olsenella sp. An293 TaxID=1965626 RepID=UPI000B56CDB1|nr:early E1A protein [Olsenella sp. An293]OUO32344.1 early E1A protein [Olsenella sp. An293]